MDQLKILKEHRKTLTDEQWLEYYNQIGFSIDSRSREERIMDAVRFDAAESGLLSNELLDP